MAAPQLSPQWGVILLGPCRNYFFNRPHFLIFLIVFNHYAPFCFSGSPRTEPGTGNRTVLEPEPAEPGIDTEPDEPEPRFGSLEFHDLFFMFGDF